MGKRSKSAPKSGAFFKFDVGLGKKKKDNTIRPKISSNRITVLPGFLSQGVKAISAKKKEVLEHHTNENILNEDLHSLFTSNKQGNLSLRRSARISKISAVNYAENSRKNLREKEPTTPKSPKHNSTPKTIEEIPYSPIPQETKQRNSRSLFKKIISSQTLSNSIHFLKSYFTNKNLSKAEFNRNVLNKLKINFKVNVAEACRKRIFAEIVKVNDILTGKVDPTTMGSFMKLTHDHMDEVEHQVPEYLFSSRDWQFATPPSQKLNITFYEESAIQPAILCNDGTARNIYQLKKEINTNFINHINPNNIEVDSRYMEPIAEFDKENQNLKNFNLNARRSADRKTEEFDFKPNFFNKYFREHLMTIQMRPKKTVKRLRFAESYTQKQMALEFSKPSTSNIYDPLAMENSELDFTFVNCGTDSEISESPKSVFKMAPRVGIFQCADNNNKGFFNSSSENMEC